MHQDIDQLRKDFKAVFDTWIAWGESTTQERDEWAAWIKTQTGNEYTMQCICNHFAQMREKYV